MHEVKSILGAALEINGDSVKGTFIKANPNTNHKNWSMTEGKKKVRKVNMFRKIIKKYSISIGSLKSTKFAFSIRIFI